MRIITVSDNGDLTIPPDILSGLDLKPGDRVDVRLVGAEIRLQVLPRNPLVEIEGAFAGSDSLVAALLEDHRRDREREDRR